MGILSHVTPSPYLAADCNAHFKINWFIHNANDVFISLRIRMNSVVSIFVNLQHTDKIEKW